MYHVVAAFTVPEEHWQTFIDAALEDGLESQRDEPGVLRFELVRDANDPNRFFLNEAYSSRLTFDMHCAGEPFKKFFATVGPFIDGPEDLVRGDTI
jgi:autoinducer 2-degrading protein